MGTGIVSILLHQLPYNADWLRYISIVFFVLNICLFLIFTFISVVRYALWPEIWAAMIRHPAQSLFLGTFPMGFASKGFCRCLSRCESLSDRNTAIINMMILVCEPWGSWLVYWAWAFWWIDAALSIATCITMPFVV
jgi:tellurite resistance protein TehA-like permease